MERRWFLQGLVGLGLGGSLASCNRFDAHALTVATLRNTLPPQLVNQFRRTLTTQALQLQIKTTPQQLFEQLETPSQPAQWLSLGDAWLALAIQTQAIQPLTQLPHWPTLDPRWQNLVKRNGNGDPDPQGKVWGLPYRWGTTVIAYREDLIKPTGFFPQDWADLWRPELKNRISLLNQPREVLGLVLKKLGHSYNTPDLQNIPGLKTALAQLRHQTKFFASTDYLQPLIMGDTWVAQAWSTDVLPVIQRYSRIKALVPQSGTALWADCWVKPGLAKVEARDSWLEFWSQAEIANQFSRFSPALSPFMTDTQADSPAAKLLLPTQAPFAASEFILPLPPASQAQYDQLWREVMLS